MADDHHGRILLFKALLRWKSYVHLCFRVKVRNLRMSLLKGRMHPSPLQFIVHERRTSVDSKEMVLRRRGSEK